MMRGSIDSSVSRRTFLGKAAASAVVLAMHDTLARASSLIGRGSTTDGGQRIASLRLRTAASLERMKAFYRDVLELEVLREAPGELTVAAGATPITFVHASPEHGAPFYHFAFNIPEQKILAARSWQRERSPIFSTPENLRDPDYPDDVRHFRGWNAHSVFFFDPAENVLEYIARHDLPATRGQGTAGHGFGPRDILYASEIAFVVDDVAAAAAGLAKNLDQQQYRGGSDQFRAMGDERGLLLVFATGRNLGRGSGKDKPCRVFPTDATIRAPAARAHVVNDYPYRIRVE
jgi:catechol 2,3-dioxygenase-like lactoylglutathione lyase family enzyme